MTAGSTWTIGILASHRGSNARRIVGATESGELEARVGLIISNNRTAEVLSFAVEHGVPARHIGGHEFEDPGVRDEAINAALVSHGCDVIVLAGYLKLLGPKTLGNYRNRILNIHPALLPKFGGQGMFGSRVHEAVLEAGDSETGVTVHLVDERYDHGAIVAQRKVAVLPGDTVSSLSARVLEAEHEFLIETLQGIRRGRLRLPGN